VEKIRIYVDGPEEGRMEAGRLRRRSLPPFLYNSKRDRKKMANLSGIRVVYSFEMYLLNSHTIQGNFTYCLFFLRFHLGREWERQADAQIAKCRD